MAKLPADLPENWTQGEIISPNGTEVGLSEQHGYNYLMKQVNATQTEVNNVGSTIEVALKDVAKEASVQEIQDKIGETTDTGGSQNSGTVNAKLNALLEAPKVIKHIQRGLITFTGSSSPSRKTESVTLVGFSNVEKMIVLLDGSAAGTRNSVTSSFTPYVQSLATDTLEVTVEYVNNSYSISYQVIEFF